MKDKKKKKHILYTLKSFLPFFVRFILQLLKKSAVILRQTSQQIYVDFFM